MILSVFFLCATLSESLRAGYSAGVPSATTVTSLPESLTVDGRGAISRQKCAEYSQYVFTSKYAPFDNAKQINVSQCAIKSGELIVGRAEAGPKEFPHMAAIGYDIEDDGIGWYCGGTLISETFVLTAAQCTRSVEAGDATWVRLGDLNLIRSDDGATPVEHRISERIRHPEYKPPSAYHDIALLRLETQVSFNDWIRPACLYTSPSRETEKVIATGWGQKEWFDDEGSDHLKKITMPLIDWQTCNQTWTTGMRDLELYNGVVEDWSICAGNKLVDTCQGDAGGPLVIPSKNEYHCMYDVVGITSIGKAHGNGIPGIYTRVYHYVPWIESVVWGSG